MKYKPIINYVVAAGIALGTALGSREVLAENPCLCPSQDNHTLDYIADSIGNQDGIVQDQEKRDLNETLKGSNEFYVLNHSYSRLWANGEDKKVYSSEEELREAYKGLGIRGGVNILRFDKGGKMTGAWLVWGYISDNPWQPIEKPKWEDSDYLSLLLKRRAEWRD